MNFFFISRQLSFSVFMASFTFSRYSEKLSRQVKKQKRARKKFFELFHSPLELSIFFSKGDEVFWRFAMLNISWMLWSSWGMSKNKLWKSSCVCCGREDVKIFEVVLLIFAKTRTSRYWTINLESLKVEWVEKKKTILPLSNVFEWRF